MSWMAITVVAVAASFLAACVLTEWFARRHRHRRRAGAKAPDPRRRTDSMS